VKPHQGRHFCAVSIDGRFRFPLNLGTSFAFTSSGAALSCGFSSGNHEHANVLM
jgi:hypothetical protein